MLFERVRSGEGMYGESSRGRAQLNARIQREIVVVSAALMERRGERRRSARAGGKLRVSVRRRPRVHRACCSASAVERRAVDATEENRLFRPFNVPRGQLCS